MRIIDVRNVHQALPIALDILNQDGVSRGSRNGDVIMAPESVTTVYQSPIERVLFHPWRDANPFFHLYESLWMLAGRNDVRSLTRFAKQMAEYSDDGESLNAAYGYRWRRSGHRRKDQLDSIIQALKANKDCRRQVLQIWDSDVDLGEPTRDAACNLTATFQIEMDGRLGMHVFCRSNDVIWGCYGANAVHFSMLQEYVALGIGVHVGTYTQISVNWHAYEKILDKIVDSRGEYELGKMPTKDRLFIERLKRDHRMSIMWAPEENPYEAGEVEPYRLMRVDRAAWDRDLLRFTHGDGVANFTPLAFEDPFFEKVARPIVEAHDIFRGGTGEARFVDASAHLAYCEASDWRRACQEWIERRRLKWMRDVDTGPVEVAQ